MTLHRLIRRIWIDPFRALRLGRLEIETKPHGGYISFLWYRKGRTNHVAHIKYCKPKPYPPLPEVITIYAQLPTLDRDLDPHHAYAIGTMLNAYTEWLNTWQTFNEQEPTYTPTQFLDWKPEQHRYGQADLHAIYKQWYVTYAITIYDGDEGGSTNLTGYFDTGNDFQGNHYFELDYMTQEFDTMLTIAMEEGKLVYHGKDHPSKT